jgi:hypothetical protein
MPVVGFITMGSLEGYGRYLPAFRAGYGDTIAGEASKSRAFPLWTKRDTALHTLDTTYRQRCGHSAVTREENSMQLHEYKKPTFEGVAIPEPPARGGGTTLQEELALALKASAPPPPPRRSWLSRNLLGVSLAGTTLLGSLYLVVESFGGPDLEVSTTRDRALHIKNLGEELIQVLDLVLNGRVECSSLPGPEGPAGPSNYNPKDERHKYWVYFGSLLAGWAATHPYQPKTLKLGDVGVWVITCDADIMRADITTSKGETTYTFHR